MSSEEMDVAAPMEVRESEGAVVEEANGVSAGGEERVVKSEPDLDELNCKVSHDFEKSEEVEGKVFDGSVNESVDATVEAPSSVSAEEPLESDAQSTSVNQTQDAAETTEGEELSEAMENSVQNDEESLKPSSSEDVSDPESNNPVECVDLLAGSATPGEPSEDLVVAEPVSTSDGVEDEPKNFDDAAELHTLAYSEFSDNEGVRAESSGEDLLERIDGETVDAFGDENKEVLEATASEEREEESSEGVEAAPSDDIEMKAAEANSEDLNEISATSEVPGNANESAEAIGEDTLVTASSDGVDPHVEEGKEAVEASAGEELEEEELTEVKSAPPISDDVADNFFENSEDLSEEAGETPTKSTNYEDVGAEVPSERSIDVVDNEPAEAPVEEAVEAAPSADRIVESPSSESVSAPSDGVEVEDVEVNCEEAAPSAESIVESPSSESVSTPDEVEIKDIKINFEEAVPSAKPMVESPSSEAACASPDDVEDKDVELYSEVMSGMTTASATPELEYVEPEVSAQESAEKVDDEAVNASVEEEEEEAGEKDNESTEATTNVDPDEKPASVELELAPSDIVNDKSVEESLESAREVRSSEDTENEDKSAILPSQESVDIVDSESVDAQVDDKEVIGETNNEEPEEELAEAGAVAASSDHVEDEAIELNFTDVSDVTTTLKSADSEDTTPEASADRVDSEAVDAPVEELTEVADAATGTKTDEDIASVGFRTVPDDAISSTHEVNSEVSAPEMDEGNINAAFSPLPIQEEVFDLNEYLMATLEHEGVSDASHKQNGLSLATHVSEIVDSEYTEVSSQLAPSSDVLEESDDVSSERHHQDSGLEEGEIFQTDRGSHEGELLQNSEAEPESDKAVFVDTEVNVEEEKGVDVGRDFLNEERLDTQEDGFPGSSLISSPEEILSSPAELASKDRSDDVAEPCDEHPLAEEVEHSTTNASSSPSIIGVERKEFPSFESVDDDGTDVAPKDLSLLPQIETTDDVKPGAVHVPEESVEVEPSLLLADALGSPYSKEVESISREINLSDFSEAPSTSKILRGETSVDLDDGMISDQVVTPHPVTVLGTANGEKEHSVETAENEREMASKSSYNHPDLDEVAAKLHHAAENTILSDNGEAEGSVVQSVAQIVLDESSRAADSAEYITGVVQHVAQFAQDASRANLNMFPDTVARGFVNDTTDSPADQPADQPVSQSQGTTSLGNMMSLFIVWCVSLCASHISSKNVPAPVLKLGAEEVTAVLHSNVQSPPASAQGTATSSH